MIRSALLGGLLIVDVDRRRSYSQRQQRISGVALRFEGEEARGLDWDQLDWD